MTDADKLFARIAENPNLPTPPAVAMQVLEKANQPECTLQEIVKVISLDPALAGKMLRLVNSAMFTLSQPVTSVPRALNLLGLKRVRTLVMSLSLPAVRARGMTEQGLQDFWKSAVAGAIIAQELARHKGETDPENEMAAGLLCDLGILILQEIFPAQYAALLSQPAEVLFQRQTELEAREFGADHAHVSAFLLERWRLPPEITEAVRYHHAPERVPPGNPAIAQRAVHLYVAGRIAQLQVVSYQPLLLKDIFSLSRDCYGMNPQQLAEFLEPVTQKIEDYAALLELKVGGFQQFPALLASVTENLTKMAMETSLENIRVTEEMSRVEAGLKKTEETLRRTEEQFRQAQKMEAVGRLAGGVAHDFNNLLTVITGYSEVLLQTLPSGDPSRPLIDEIKNAGDRASALTRQLLAFSRKQVLTPALLDLNTIVAAMEKMLRRLIGEDIELVVKSEPQLHTVTADPGQVEQVIMNLAVNARDAMPQGGTLTIQTANADLDDHYVAPYPELRAGTYVRLAISDTGCGMSPETKAHLFEPFFTTKEKGKGTGLGLATVHGIIKQSNGQINVYTELGRGTTFNIYLPASGARPTHPAQPRPVETLRGSETVLLAEDEDGVRKVARRALEMYGYRVLEARHGWEALVLAEQHGGAIHLLLTDTIMPFMGGSELAYRLSQARPGVRVLYTSGYTDDAIVRHGVLTAGTPFLQKPYSPQLLVQKVREVLDVSRN